MATTIVGGTSKYPDQSPPDSLNMMDVAQRFNSGLLVSAVDLLQRREALLGHAIIKESTQDHFERADHLRSEPTNRWIAERQGRLPEKSQVTVEWPMAHFATMTRVDMDTYEAADGRVLRSEEDRRAIAGLSKTVASCLWYGNGAIDPRQFTGVMPQYASVSQPTVEGRTGGAGNNNLSFVVLNWDFDSGCYVIYPKDHPSMGITIYDSGMAPLVDLQNGGELLAYRTFIDIRWGFVIRREDMCGRYGGIQADDGTGFDWRQLSQLYHNLYSPAGAKMYANRKGRWLYNMFLRQRRDVAAPSQWGRGGGPAPFDGDLPVLSESLRMTEAQLAA